VSAVRAALERIADAERAGTLNDILEIPLL
jgi:hypothetical protein